VAKRDKKTPRYLQEPADKQVRLGADPDYYMHEKPVWTFRSFDWDGPWGVTACAGKDWRKHIESHLASFETMTWAAIQAASGGKGSGNNSHHLPRSKFTAAARKRLTDKGIFSDTFFSLRLENTTRIYGVREGNCLRIVWFDPHHFADDSKAAYDWSSN
jgi:hypothetical protein